MRDRGRPPPDSEDRHIPVLLEEVLEELAVHSGMMILDGTVGAGGHAEAILERSSPDGILIGIDRDPEILKIANQRLKRFGKRVRLYHCRFSKIDSVLDQEGIRSVDAFLLDLGVSSYQLDQAERGFSFLKEGPLDMRMDRTEKTWTAAQFVNRLPERELADLFYRYGEERKSRKIARAIAQRRGKRPFQTTLDLAQWVEGLLGRSERIHPATRVFQALRIAANEELKELETSLGEFLSRLKVKGKGAVISFHSLEDRIVKKVFREEVHKGGFRLLAKKPITASRVERRENRRSRSAKLRTIERL